MNDSDRCLMQLVLNLVGAGHAQAEVWVCHAPASARASRTAKESVVSNGQSQGPEWRRHWPSSRAKSRREDRVGLLSSNPEFSHVREKLRLPDILSGKLTHWVLSFLIGENI